MIVFGATNLIPVFELEDTNLTTSAVDFVATLLAAPLPSGST